MAKKKQKVSSWNESVKKFRSFDAISQEQVQIFFNLHNAAVFLYNQLDEDAKSYVDFLVSYRPQDDEKEMETLFDIKEKS